MDVQSRLRMTALMTLVTYACPVLTRAGRVLAVLGIRRDPRHLRQRASLCLRHERAQRADAARLAVLVHVGEARQHIPDQPHSGRIGS